MRWPFRKKSKDKVTKDRVYTDFDVMIGDSASIGPGDSGYEMLMEAMQNPNTVIMGNRNDDGTWNIEHIERREP